MNTNTATALLTLTVIAAEDLSEAIWTAKAADRRVSSWISTTTAFRFEGGEALSVVTGYGADVRVYVISVIDGEAQVVEARGVVEALKWRGYRAEIGLEPVAAAA